MAGERLDLISGDASPPVVPQVPVNDSNPPAAQSRGEPFLGIQFRCCSIYSRIYRNREQTAYEGRCPRCARPVYVRIGGEGIGARFFEVG